MIHPTFRNFKIPEWRFQYMGIAAGARAAHFERILLCALRVFAAYVRRLELWKRFPRHPHQLVMRRRHPRQLRDRLPRGAHRRGLHLHLVIPQRQHHVDRFVPAPDSKSHRMLKRPIPRRPPIRRIIEQDRSQFPANRNIQRPQRRIRRDRTIRPLKIPPLHPRWIRQDIHRPRSQKLHRPHISLLRCRTTTHQQNASTQNQ
jgi:hypothetical protein